MRVLMCEFPPVPSPLIWNSFRARRIRLTSTTTRRIFSPSALPLLSSCRSSPVFPRSIVSASSEFRPSSRDSLRTWRSRRGQVKKHPGANSRLRQQVRHLLPEVASEVTLLARLRRRTPKPPIPATPLPRPPTPPLQIVRPVMLLVLLVLPRGVRMVVPRPSRQGRMATAKVRRAMAKVLVPLAPSASARGRTKLRPPPGLP